MRQNQVSDGTDKRLPKSESPTGKGLSPEGKSRASFSSGADFRRWSQYDIPALILCLIPGLFICRMILLYSVNVPFWDNWIMLIAPEVNREGLLSHWMLANEHRVFIPRLIQIFLARMSNFNALWWVWSKIPAVFLITVLEFLMIRARVSRKQMWVIIPFLAAFNFSFVYWPLWIDPRPLGSHCALLGFLFSLWVITNFPQSRGAFTAALGGAVFSSLSFSSGNSSWPILGVLLWLAGYRKTRQIVIWTAAALSILIPYTIDILHSPNAFRTGITTGIGALIRYALVFIASPLSSNHRHRVAPRATDLGIGLFGVVAATILVILLCRFIRDGKQKTLPWLGLMVWVGTAALAAGFGRASFNAHQPLSTRYVNLSSGFWIALVMMAFLAFGVRRKTHPKRMETVILPLVSLLVLAAVASYLTRANVQALRRPNFFAFSTRLERGKHCIEKPETAEDSCLKLLYPDPVYLRKLMENIDVIKPSFLEKSASDSGQRSPGLPDETSCESVHVSGEP